MIRDILLTHTCAGEYTTLTSKQPSSETAAERWGAVVRTIRADATLLARTKFVTRANICKHASKQQHESFAQRQKKKTKQTNKQTKTTKHQINTTYLDCARWANEKKAEQHTSFDQPTTKKTINPKSTRQINYPRTRGYEGEQLPRHNMCVCVRSPASPWSVDFLKSTLLIKN
jgi:hypothetical protein